MDFIAARLRLGAVADLKSMLRATLDDGTPDYRERAAGAEVLRTLQLKYPGVDELLEGLEAAQRRLVEPRLTKDTQAD